MLPDPMVTVREPRSHPMVDAGSTRVEFALPPCRAWDASPEMAANVALSWRPDSKVENEL